MSDKKKMQLGMNPSTAANRLVKDLLWNFIETTGQDACCKCGEPMSRETFSIEHVTPWLDSDDPVGLYFDLGNIGFSHLSCNIEDRRRSGPPLTLKCGEEGMYNKGCRCDLCRSAAKIGQASRYTSQKRRERYLRTGK